MKVNTAEPQKTIVKIIGGKQPSVALLSDHYWEIVGELIWRGAERIDAYDAAKWAYRAESGLEKQVNPGILMKIRKT